MSNYPEAQAAIHAATYVSVLTAFKYTHSQYAQQRLHHELCRISHHEYISLRLQDKLYIDLIARLQSSACRL